MALWTNRVPVHQACRIGNSRLSPPPLSLLLPTFYWWQARTQERQAWSWLLLQLEGNLELTQSSFCIQGNRPAKLKDLSKISQPRNDGRILGQGAGYASLFCTSFPSLWLWLQHFWKAVSWAETGVFLGATCSVVGPRIVFPSGSAWLLCLAGSYMSQCVAGGYRSHLLHRALEILIIEVTKV